MFYSKFKISLNQFAESKKKFSKSDRDRSEEMRNRRIDKFPLPPSSCKIARADQLRGIFF